MSDLELRLEPKQALRISPQLLQATRMLLMPAQELSHFLERAAEENPLLEAESPASLQNAYAQLRRAASRKAAVPDTPNSGSQADRELHLAPPSGKKLGRLGSSGGKKRV